MYCSLAELEIFWPSDGEVRHRFSGDPSGGVPSMINLINPAPLSEYDFGGDLFNAPEPIIEEPFLELDPITAAICLMSSGEDVGAVEAMKVAEIDSIQNEHLLSEVFYDCKKDLLEKSAIKVSFDEPQDAKLPAVQVGQGLGMEEVRFATEGLVQRSVSYGCLKSTEWDQVKPNYKGLEVMNFEDSYGIRRAYSEGDIHALGNGGSNVEEDKAAVPSSRELVGLRELTIEGKLEERMEKINRYKKKKSTRNFGRKIKYACRKALADSQPRVRGRFAKNK